MRGMSALKKVKKTLEKNREAMAAYGTPDFILKDGESAIVWFNGAEDTEPYVTMEHSASINKRFTSLTCAREKAKAGEHEGCVACHRVQKGDKRVKRASTKFVFNLIDTRFVHQIKDEERTAATGFDKFQYPPCVGKGCKFCKRGNEKQRAGQKKFRVSPTWAQALSSVNDELKNRCKLCGGKTKITGYVHVETGEEAKEPEEGHEEEFEAKYQCLKCKKRKPVTMFDVAIKIIRSGEGTSTSYQFMPDKEEEREAWMKKCEPVDLEKACGPIPADKQAERLGVENPFDGTGGGDDDEPKRGKKRKGDDDDAVSYTKGSVFDDDEEEADDDDDDDEEE